jgi:hypothetical protein
MTVRTVITTHEAVTSEADATDDPVPGVTGIRQAVGRVARGPFGGVRDVLLERDDQRLRRRVRLLLPQVAPQPDGQHLAVKVPGEVQQVRLDEPVAVGAVVRRPPADRDRGRDPGAVGAFGPARPDSVADLAVLVAQRDVGGGEAQFPPPLVALLHLATDHEVFRRHAAPVPAVTIAMNTTRRTEGRPPSTRREVSTVYSVTP